MRPHTRPGRIALSRAKLDRRRREVGLTNGQLGATVATLATSRGLEFTAAEEVKRLRRALTALVMSERRADLYALVLNVDRGELEAESVPPHPAVERVDPPTPNRPRVHHDSLAERPAEVAARSER
jgi:hypothetical protein